MFAKFFQLNRGKLILLLATGLLVALSLVLVLGKSPAWKSAQAAEPLVASVQDGGVASVVDVQTVVLDKLPQAKEFTGQPQQIRSHSGVSAEEELARKQKVVGITPLNEPMSEPVMPEQGQLLTPSASPNFAGIGATGWVPSDMALAVGPSYVVQVVNESIAVYGKAGAIQAGFPKTLQAFACGGCGNSLFDPRAFYDWQSSRYVVLFARDNGAASSSFYLAASQTNDPRGAWWIYQLTYGIAGEFGDFPTLGFDNEGIYTCASTFAPGFVNNKCFIIPKASVYAGAAFSYYWFSGFNVGGTVVDSIQPVKTTENNRPRAEFMVNSFNILFGGGQCWAGCSGVVVWSISNPFGFIAGGPAPVVSGWVVGTSTYVLPPDANAPGCPNCVATNDPRISFQPTYNAGSIWAAVPTAVGDPVHSGILWWEIGVALNDNGGGCVAPYLNLCPTLSNAYLKQEGLYWYGGDSAAYFPAIQSDAENNVVMTFAYSNSTVLPSIVYAGRRINYTLNTFRDSGIYLSVGAGSVTHWNRWGDYFATGIDENLKPWKMWIAGQRNNGANSWATRIGAVTYSGKANP